MNVQIGNSLPNEKLDKTRFTSWVYKIKQILIQQVYLGYTDAKSSCNSPSTLNMWPKQGGDGASLS